MPAFEHKHLAANRAREILRPVAERRQRGARRQPDAHRRDLRKIAALDNGVDEMGRADHNAVDSTTRDRWMEGKLGERRHDPGGDVLSGRRLDRIYDMPVC